MDRLVLDDKNVSVTQIIASHNQYTQNMISELVVLPKIAFQGGMKKMIGTQWGEKVYDTLNFVFTLRKHVEVCNLSKVLLNSGTEFMYEENHSV